MPVLSKRILPPAPASAPPAAPLGAIPTIDSKSPGAKAATPKAVVVAPLTAAQIAAGYGVLLPPVPAYAIDGNQEGLFPVDVGTWVKAVTALKAKGRQASTRFKYTLHWPTFGDPALKAQRDAAVHKLWARYSTVGEAMYAGYKSDANASVVIGQSAGYTSSKDKQHVEFKASDFLDCVTCPPPPDVALAAKFFHGRTCSSLNLCGATVCLPLLDGLAPLWVTTPPQEVEDAYWAPVLNPGRKDPWLVYVKWLGGDSFEFTLTPKPAEFSLTGTLEALFFDVVHALETLLQDICKIVTSDDMQQISNYAAAVPNPHVQAAAAAWKVAGAACGIAFPPPNGQPTCLSCSPPPPPPPMPVTFWDTYKWWVVGGVAAAGGAAMLGISARNRRRGSVVG